MIIYQPTTLTSPVGKDFITINQASVGLLIPMQVTDTPPTGTLSELDLTGTTLKSLYALPFNNSTSAMVTLLGALTSIGSSPTLFTYAPTSADLAALAGFQWRLAFLATFANGQDLYVNSEFVFVVNVDNTTSETMDLNTPIGAVRFLLRDTDLSNPFFTDGGIAFLLQAANEYNAITSTTSITLNLIYYAVSLGYMQMAADAAFVAQNSKGGLYSIDTATAQKALLGMSQQYKALALQETVLYTNSSQIGWPLVPHIPGQPYYPDPTNPANPWPTDTTLESPQEW